MPDCTPDIATRSTRTPSQSSAATTSTSGETTEELRDRRSKYALADDEQGYLEHFQTRAYGAEMGTVNPVPNTRTRNTYTDKIFTLEFLESENPRFVRGQIVNMIYNSENLLPRMRCTTLKVTPAPAGTTRSRRGVPPGEDRDDVWKVDTMVFTQRTPTARERS